jgi:ABC-2 type transport system permease protein
VSKLLNQFIGITIMLSIPTKRNPIWHLAISVIPIGLFFVFFLIGGISLSYDAMLGALIAFAINAGIVSLPQLVIFLRAYKLQDMFVASPVNPIVYTLSIAFSRFIYVSPVMIILFIVLLINRVIYFSVVPATLLVILVAWLSGSAMGFVMATYVRNVIYISSVANLAGILINFIPPVYYPLSLIPEKYRWLAILFPSSSAAELVRLVNGRSDPQMVGYLPCIIIVVFYAVVGFLLVAYKSKWRET